MTRHETKWVETRSGLARSLAGVVLVLALLVGESTNQADKPEGLAQPPIVYAVSQTTGRRMAIELICAQTP